MIHSEHRLCAREGFAEYVAIVPHIHQIFRSFYSFWKTEWKLINVFRISKLKDLPSITHENVLTLAYWSNIQLLELLTKIFLILLLGVFMLHLHTDIILWFDPFHIHIYFDFHVHSFVFLDFEYFFISVTVKIRLSLKHLKKEGVIFECLPSFSDF